MPSLRDAAWLREEIEAGASARQIAEAAGVTPNAVRVAVLRDVIPLPTEGRLAHVDREALRADWPSGMAGPAIAQKHGLAVRTVYYLMSGVKREQPVVRNRRSRYEQLNDPAWLRVQLALGRSMRSIATDLGCDDGVVSTWVRRHGITPPPADMPRIDRIEARADPDEQPETAAVVDAKARVDAARAARIKSAAMAAKTAGLNSGALPSSPAESAPGRTDG